MSRLVWEYLGVPLDESVEMASERIALISLFKLLLLQPRPGEEAENQTKGNKEQETAITPLIVLSVHLNLFNQ